MRIRTSITLIAAVLWTWIVSGGESAFYTTFLHSVSTSDLTNIVAVRSPLLVDTSNMVAKVTGSTNSLRKMKEEGELCGVRLGMNMSEVVTTWGKPPRFYTKCHGGPHFAYCDVGLYFQGDVLQEIYVPASNLDMFYRSGKDLHFDGELTASSTVHDVAKILGEPTQHVTDQRRDRDYWVWEVPTHTLKFGFDLESKRISHITLQKRSDR
jgi:hypothetical protein